MIKYDNPNFWMQESYNRPPITVSSLDKLPLTIVARHNHDNVPLVALGALATMALLQSPQMVDMIQRNRYLSFVFSLAQLQKRKHATTTIKKT